MRIKQLTGLSLLILAGSTSLLAADDIQDTRDTLQQWVQTRQIISEEQSDWKLEQSILKDTEALLIKELERLNQALEDFEAAVSAADEDRAKLAAESEALVEASSAVESEIVALEMQLHDTVNTLPQPLFDKIKPLIRRLPDDPTTTVLTLGERVQNIVAILSQTDKFNTTITQTSESREVGDGRVLEVRTLYWGLAMAYYVDASGEYAGIGVPGADGWEWPQLEGSGAQIKHLLDVYEGTEEIQFVEVPAHIK
ncbi:MAG: hypothetical protein ACI9ZV_000456 [Candidatus Azotimanducaceae bacterium]|jgi:hypothetical protein